MIEEAGSRDQDKLLSHREFKASLDYIRPWQKEKKTENLMGVNSGRSNHIPPKHFHYYLCIYSNFLIFVLYLR